jgi:hypothetical protein
MVMESVDTPEPVVKKLITKSSMDSVKARSSPVMMPWHNLWDNHLPQGPAGVQPRSKGRFIKVLVELPQLRQDRENHIRER